jgi:hypothetical protein
MILGRTPAGLIKTKTDGGLRAVGCACCGVIPCGAARVSAELKAILENSNTVTVSGGHSAAWDGSSVNISPAPPDYINWSIVYIDDLIYVGVLGDTGSDPYVILISEPLTLEDCGGEEGFSIFVTITIQGKSYRAFDLFGDEPPFPLTVTFS